MMKAVFVITHIPFWRRSSGDKARLLALVTYLNKWTRLTIGYIGDKVEYEAADGLRIVQFNRPDSRNIDGLVITIRDFISVNIFDACIIEYAFLSFLLPAIPDNVTKILDTHDIVSQRNQSFRAFGARSNDITDLTEKEEHHYFSKYEYVMAIKKADYEKIAEIIGTGKVILAPHPVIGKKQPVRDVVTSIGYVASNYLPNIDAMRWFLSAVWPNLLELPITLKIIGTIGNDIDASAIRNIEMTGMVGDIDEIYQGIDLVINPVRFGGGLKIKNVEALAYGLPLVTTSHGSKGLEEAADVAFLVADEPQLFARHIRTLVCDQALRRRLGEAAYSYAATWLSPEKCFQSLLSVINN
jgi:glycosyltransferase involved in cell wall biosynthesis